MAWISRANQELAPRPVSLLKDQHGLVRVSLRSIQLGTKYITFYLTSKKKSPTLTDMLQDEIREQDEALATNPRHHS